MSSERYQNCEAKISLLIKTKDKTYGLKEWNSIQNDKSFPTNHKPMRPNEAKKQKKNGDDEWLANLAKVW